MSVCIALIRSTIASAKVVLPDAGGPAMPMIDRLPGTRPCSMKLQAASIFACKVELGTTYTLCFL